MAAQHNDTVTQIFRQTNETLANFLNAGLQMQQDAFRVLGRTQVEPLAPQQVRGRVHDVADATVALIDKNTDESRKLVDVQTRETVELVKKNVDAFTVADKFDAVEASRTAFNNTLETTGLLMRSALQAGTTMIENWSEFVTHTTNGRESGTSTTAKKTRSK